MKKAKDMAVQGVVAALYVAVTVALSATSFGPVQFRVSSMMHQLVAYKKRYAIGLLIGVVIANAFSPLGVIDVAFGCATSAVGYLAAFVAMKAAKSQIAKDVIVGVCVTASTIFVALELHMLYGLPVLATWATVAAGQAATQVVGIPVVAAIDKMVHLS